MVRIDLLITGISDLLGGLGGCYLACFSLFPCGMKPARALLIRIVSPMLVFYGLYLIFFQSCIFQQDVPIKVTTSHCDEALAKSLFEEGNQKFPVDC